MIRIHREAKSRLSVEVQSATDPQTGTVSFAFPLRGQRPSTFVAGAWFGDSVFDNEDKIWRREALTPRIGQDVVLVANHYRFFGKLVIGADEDVWEIDEEGLEVQ